MKTCKCESRTEDRLTDAGAEEADAGQGTTTAREGSTAGVERQDHLSLVPERHAATEG